MNITIAVALITSLSTLTAGLTASLIGLKVQTRQISAQANLADKERAEKLLEMRTESRKQAHLHFLNRLSDVEALFETCWHAAAHGNPDGKIGKLSTKTLDAIMELNRSFSLLAVEGPLEATWRALEIQAAVADEMEMMLKISDGSNTGKPISVAVVDRYSEAMDTRGRAKLAFIISLEHGTEMADSISEKRADQSNDKKYQTS